ncbi:MAG: hypothetical protein HGB19_04045 [Chlorobiales bacterium]|jgi:hypothetical protein|nr:hypothetical protein [Chlorobiales bacterium]
MSKEKDNRTEVRKMPDTVRTAGKDSVRETDLGSNTSKPKRMDDKPGAKKTRLKWVNDAPDSVRTAGQPDAMSTDD